MYEMRKRKQTHENARHMRWTKILVQKLGKWRTRHLGGHDLVRRMDRQGEVLIWCIKCSGYARQRMGPKLMNCCRPEQMDTKEFGKMENIIQILEEGRVPAQEAKNWRIEGEKKRITRKEYKRLVNNFEMEGLLVQKSMWKLAKEK